MTNKTDNEKLIAELNEPKVCESEMDYKRCNAYLCCLAQDAANALQAAQEEINELKEQLSKFQHSEFHPDWSLLQATQESLREYMELLRQSNTKLAAIRDAADTFPELNTNNYNHDDVCNLNSWGINLILEILNTTNAQPAQEQGGEE